MKAIALLLVASSMFCLAHGLWYEDPHFVLKKYDEKRNPENPFTFKQFDEHLKEFRKKHPNEGEHEFFEYLDHVRELQSHLSRILKYFNLN